MMSAAVLHPVVCVSDIITSRFLLFTGKEQITLAQQLPSIKQGHFTPILFRRKLTHITNMNQSFTSDLMHSITPESVEDVFIQWISFSAV